MILLQKSVIVFAGLLALNSAFARWL